MKCLERIGKGPQRHSPYGWVYPGKLMEPKLLPNIDFPLDEGYWRIMIYCIARHLAYTLVEQNESLGN